MQQLQPSDLDRLNLQSHNGIILESSEEPEIVSLSLIRRIEIWSGRLAMFSLTTMLAAIAVNAH
jgi:hypothetical protein